MTEQGTVNWKCPLTPAIPVLRKLRWGVEGDRGGNGVEERFPFRSARLHSELQGQPRYTEDGSVGRGACYTSLAA